MYLVKWKHLFLSVTNAGCFWLAYADKSPFVQKTQAFEKFFMQRIELYDKVSEYIFLCVCVYLSNYIDAVAYIFMCFFFQRWSPSQLWNVHDVLFVSRLSFEVYFITWNISQDEIERKGSILVDYKELIEDRELTKSIPNISTELRDMPQKILQCMGLAIHQVSLKFWQMWT